MHPIHSLNTSRLAILNNPLQFETQHNYHVGNDVVQLVRNICRILMGSEKERGYQKDVYLAGREIIKINLRERG
jgi:hypothetical protein